MADPRVKSIEVTEKEQLILATIVRRANSPQAVAKRARVILSMVAGKNNSEVEKELGLSRVRVSYWRRHWLSESAKLRQAEKEGLTDKELAKLIEQTLRDEQRSGAPATFSAEQIVQIVAVACEAPVASGRPISHWSKRELVEEVIKRGIVKSISARQVGRFLKSGRVKAAQNGVLVKCSTGE